MPELLTKVRWWWTQSLLWLSQPSGSSTADDEADDPVVKQVVKEQDGTLSLVVTATVSLILLSLFFYSLSHPEPYGYFLSGKRSLSLTSIAGPAFLVSVVSFFVQLRKRK